MIGTLGYAVAKLFLVEVKYKTKFTVEVKQNLRNALDIISPSR